MHEERGNENENGGIGGIPSKRDFSLGNYLCLKRLTAHAQAS